MVNSRHIIVAEDNPRERQFLVSVLRDYAVTEASNGTEALKASLACEEPWVVSDMQMPEVNGIELARQLWARRPAARIVFWSHHKDEMYVRSLAKIIPPETDYGYVLKENAAPVLERAVRAVFLDCQCWIDPGLRPVASCTKNSQSALTDAEYDVLIDIALGLTDHMIARRRYLSRRGAQSRLNSLYGKLGITQERADERSDAIEIYNLRSRAVAFALHRGLINPFELKREEERFRAWFDSIKNEDKTG